MANFLNRMAERALGSVVVVQPVVPALFTPGFGLAQSAAPIDVGALGHKSEVSFVSDPAIAPAREPARDATLPREWQPFDSKLAVRDPSSVPPRDTSSGQEKVSPVTAAMPATQPALLPASMLDLQYHREGADALDHVATSANKSDETAVDMDRRKITEPSIAPRLTSARRPNMQPFRFGPALTGRDQSSASHRDQAGGAAPEPPVIRVTIGRIDVRAQFPATAPSPAPSRRARTTALTLDDYLKQRSEGKR